MARPRNTREKIEKNIDKSGGEESCWPWLGHTDKDGYPLSTLNYVTYGVHRLMLSWYTLDEGNGLFALHSCDNPVCCNPNHLRWGSAKENAADRDSRHKGMLGKTKLNNPDRLAQSIKVSKTFRLTSPDGTVYEDRNLKDFATRHNLSYSCISYLCRGYTDNYKGWTGKYEDLK